MSKGNTPDDPFVDEALGMVDSFVKRLTTEQQIHLLQRRVNHLEGQLAVEKKLRQVLTSKVEWLLRKHKHEESL